MLRKIFSVDQQGNFDMLLLMVRVAIAVFMIVGHGWPKLMMLFGDEPVQFISFLGLSATASLALAVFAELFCSILILFGFGTRLAVIPLLVTMLVAVFYVHSNDPFVKYEMGLHYIIVYLLLFFTGSGKISADYYFEKRLLSREAVRR